MLYSLLLSVNKHNICFSKILKYESLLGGNTKKDLPGDAIVPFRGSIGVKLPEISVTLCHIVEHCTVEMLTICTPNLAWAHLTKARQIKVSWRHSARNQAKTTCLQSIFEIQFRGD